MASVNTAFGHHSCYFIGSVKVLLGYCRVIGSSETVTATTVLQCTMYVVLLCNDDNNNNNNDDDN